MGVGAAQQQQACLDRNAELASHASRRGRQAGQNQFPSQHPFLTCPHRLHISRRYGCPLRRAPRASDGRPVLAGLLARGSDALPSLPGPSRSGPVADVDKARRLQLRGQPRIESVKAQHRVPFSPARVVARLGTSTAHKQSDDLVTVKCRFPVKTGLLLHCLTGDAVEQRIDLGQRCFGVR